MSQLSSGSPPWPDSLLDQMVLGRWVLFVGAGVSASCSNDLGERPPDWTQLLELLASQIHHPGRKAEAHSLIGEKDLLRAAEQIRWSFAKEGRSNDYSNLIVEAVTGPSGHPFKRGKIHDDLIDLEPRIIVTTNYDSLLDSVGYATQEYESNTFAHEVRIGAAVIMHLHGSTRARQKIVLTRSDYHRLRRDGGHVLDTLRAAFTNQMVLFVGYGVRDPDVHLLLEATSGFADPEAHYMITRAGFPEWEVESFSETFGVRCLSIPGDLEATIADLADAYRSKQAAVG